MPTLEDFTDVYNIPKKTDPAYQGKIDVLFWYIDTYLVACAGLYLCSAYNRRYMKMSEAVVLPNGDRVPVVPVEAEAFGWLMLQNCQAKWGTIVPLKVTDPNFKIPPYSKDNISTHQYHDTKWTDAKTGKDQGGGWDTSAYPVFGSYIKTIQAIREADKKKGYPMQKMCLALIQEKHGVTAEDERPKKRRRGGKKKPKLAPAFDTTFNLQVKDEFADDIDVKVQVDGQGNERGNI